ncbi:DNA repair protein SWI5 homolog [Watersipora subatra]|uniref:DNA repair protein SWI5 homolog n=1 Tax=Watersipora subatra TaxID=2589382 RepID=UPI00355B9A47
MSEKDELELVKGQIAELKENGISTDDLPKYITALHKLNEMKDSTEIILGKLAEVRCVTVKDLHDEFDLQNKLLEASSSKKDQLSTSS